ncbi:AaceriABL159Wp [[Ashbya] aceris (nom. inval.)]|nr:AaceriABL159Wp [[Ashbya] aceris (nom. inval.)]
MTAVQHSNALPPALFRRKKEQKRGVTYSVLLVGPSGTGKTTFANNLLESTIFSHRYQTESPQYQNPMVKVVNPTRVVTFNSKNGIPSYQVPFDPMGAHLEPGITITATSVEVSTDSASDDPRDKMCFNLIDTHGIGENLDNELCFDEVVAYLEQQFDLVLAEETRIKRNPRFEDGRIHAALYFVEPTGHGLRELDIEMMKRLSRYTNVLPIIARADSFTEDELSSFKAAVMRDIENYNVPVYKFEVDEDEDDPETLQEVNDLASIQPFAVVCSDTKGKDGRYVRAYPWGDLFIDDETISDLRVLKSVLFGSYLQEFKDTTHNLLYENYRAEKLSSISEWDTTKTSSKGTIIKTEKNSSTPSLSNFASIVNSGNLKSQQSLTKVPNSEVPAPSTPSNESDSLFRETESPIRKMSVNIRRDNEEIIRNIKSSPSTADSGSQDRTKLRNISETLPYVLRHERIIAKQQKLEELEAQSARELQKRIQELEKKAMELKLKEKLLKQQKRNGSTTSIGSTVTATSAASTNLTSGKPSVMQEGTPSTMNRARNGSLVSPSTQVSPSADSSQFASDGYATRATGQVQ